MSLHFLDVRRKLQVLDADYSIQEDKSVIRLFCRNDSGGKEVVVDRGFRPYFYVLSGDLEKTDEKIQETDFEKDDERLEVVDTEKVERKNPIEEEEVLKVYGKVPPEIPKLRAEVSKLELVEECREFDIPFYKRYIIDNQIPPADWIEVELEEDEEYDHRLVSVEDLDAEGDQHEFDTLAFDLEVFDDKVEMASFYSEDFELLLTTAEIDRDYVETVEDEEELIRRFKEVIDERDPDVITGYNTDEFDFQVLRERAQSHGMEMDIGIGGERVKFDRRGRFSSARVKGRMHLDLYPFIAHVLSPGLDSETLDLDSVAEEMLGRNKDDLDFEKMKESWEDQKDLGELADYGLKDSELAFQLAEEIVPQIFELSRITGLIPFDACRLTYGQLTENFLLREAYRRNKLSPNRPFRDEREKRRRQGAYTGGFVYSPDPGLYEDIALLDFKSLYPTVMVSHNISPETLELEDCGEEYEIEKFGYSFCQDFQGFFPELIEDLITERTEIKQKLGEAEGKKKKSLDSRQRALKILANSFYGYLGYEGARWYSKEAAEATTYLGREYIKYAVEKAEEDGFEVVYGDTDSVFLRKDDLKAEIDDYLESVNDELPSFMELELEGYFKRGFFTSKDSGEGAKKKYALMKEDGSMKITGFEYVRRDWSPVAKETQEKVLRKVLEDKTSEAAEIVKETIQELKDREIPVEDLKIYTKLTKKPENYDSTAPHVEAAKKAMKRGDDISPEDNISYVITRGGGSISERAELVKYADDYDADYYIDKQIIPVSIRVLKVFGYTSEELKGKGRQSGLDSF